MSNYFRVRRESRSYSGTEEFKSLRKALKYIKAYLKNNEFPSEYTFTITEEPGWELLEKKELKRLKKKYEPKL